MSGNTKPHRGVSGRGLGMAIRHHRENANLTLEKAGAVLGWSANTMSRLERGLRPDTTSEEISALLAVMGVMGEDRDRLMRMVLRHPTQGWWESHDANLSDQARTYLGFESRARRIIDVEPLLVPGLLQTAGYLHALLVASGVDRSRAPGRVARRLSRQKVLTRRWNPPQLEFVMCETALRQPIGGYQVMADQVRYIARAARREHVAARVIPAGVAAHPALLGAFVVLEFADEPPVVFTEGRGSGMFPDDPTEIDDYRRAAERSMELALSERESLDLVLAIAADMDGARSGG